MLPQPSLQLLLPAVSTLSEHHHPLGILPQQRHHPVQEMRVQLLDSIQADVHVRVMACVVVFVRAADRAACTNKPPRRCSRGVGSLFGCFGRDITCRLKLQLLQPVRAGSVSMLELRQRRLKVVGAYSIKHHQPLRVELLLLAQVLAQVQVLVPVLLVLVLPVLVLLVVLVLLFVDVAVAGCHYSSLSCRAVEGTEADKIVHRVADA
jgi:hypothetical protein